VCHLLLHCYIELIPALLYRYLHCCTAICTAVPLLHCCTSALHCCTATALLLPGLLHCCTAALLHCCTAALLLPALLR
jgi:hypothetical protein